MFGKLKNNNVVEQVEKKKKPFYKRWWFVALVVIVIIGALGGGGEDKPEDGAKEPIEQVAATAGNEAKREFTESEKELLKKSYVDFTEEEREEYEELSYKYSKYNDEYSNDTKAEWRDEFVRLQAEALEIFEQENPVEPEVAETLSQKNAVGKAEDYLNFMAFSKSGLIEQLKYEGFSAEDATYAVDKITVDWNEQALLKAENYLSTMAFSKSGLVEQLGFEGFSDEEATYAINNIDADWNEQAAKKAQDYLNTMSFSKTGLIEQLEFEGFTNEEAIYGVDQTGL